jgi:hypothetical protein
LTKVLGFWEIKKYLYSFKLETSYDQLFHKQIALGCLQELVIFNKEGSKLPVLKQWENLEKDPQGIYSFLLSYEIYKIIRDLKLLSRNLSLTYLESRT